MDNGKETTNSSDTVNTPVTTDADKPASPVVCAKRRRRQKRTAPFDSQTPLTNDTYLPIKPEKIKTENRSESGSDSDSQGENDTDWQDNGDDLDVKWPSCCQKNSQALHCQLIQSTTQMNHNMLRRLLKTVELDSKLKSSLLTRLVDVIENALLSAAESDDSGSESDEE